MTSLQTLRVSRQTNAVVPSIILKKYKVFYDNAMKIENEMICAQLQLNSFSLWTTLITKGFQKLLCAVHKCLETCTAENDIVPILHIWLNIGIIGYTILSNFLENGSNSIKSKAA